MNIDFLRSLASIVPPIEPVTVAKGPNPCCASDSLVTHCDGETDTYKCGTCGAVWIDRCPDADLWTPEGA